MCALRMKQKEKGFYENLIKHVDFLDELIDKNTKKDGQMPHSEKKS
jgi:hypothetical protein